MNTDRFLSRLRNRNQPTLLMGVLNVTPDSFSDGGQFIYPDAAIEQALMMERSGADIIDIGGESTRPGSDPVALEVELNRVMPVIQGLRKKSDVMISIDTCKAQVAWESVAAGANLINDISGLTFDREMPRVVSESNVPVVIMHIKGTPKNMQIDPTYKNLMGELRIYFQERIAFAIENGIATEQIIIDPGIGFGKMLNDNFKIIRELKQLADLGYPVLIGPSRKSFIGNILKLPVDQRLEGTAATVTAAILNGARMVRLHDVVEMKRVIIIADKIRGIA